MLAIIPILMFFATFLYLLGRQQDETLAFSDWRGPFLQACLIWGVVVVAISELLSLFSLLSRSWVAILWVLTLVVIILIGWRRGVFPRALAAVKSFQWRAFGWSEWLLLGGMAAIALILWFVAWNSLPNTTDSLHYHMSRVAHWTQNQNLRHYPTAYDPQLMHPIWAETVIFHLRLLWGGDNPVGLVQWFSMLGSLVGVSAIASLLGSNRSGQLLAAAFTVSIPIGILQATSTQNDYVTAFWLVCLAYFILLGKKRSLRREEWVGLGIVIGLGLLTKSIFYAYALPFGIWLFLPRLLRHGLRQVLKEGMCIAGVAVAINLGFWSRNLITYGGPFGSSHWLRDVMVTDFRPASLLSAWARDLALNLPTPSARMNDIIIRGVESFHAFLGTDPGEFGLIWSWNHEDLAGNPLHLFLILLTLIALLILAKRARISLPVHYALVVIASFLVLSSILGFTPYGVRFQLPFFVLWAPIVGVVGWLIRQRRAMVLASTLLILAALPWVLLNRSRPIIGLYPYTMMSESIFREPPEVVLFANWTEIGDPYIAATEAVKASGCRDVGLQIDSHHLEYPYWWLLDAPKSGIRIESVETYPHLERYRDPSFKPCIIICMVCGDRERLHGLERQDDFGGGIVLFSGSGYTPDEDG